ncbi:PorV/PorQ family protein [Elusimicrobiota bacterium]
MKKRILLTGILLLLSETCSFAGAGTTAVNFLKMPQGNRATAMGSSFVAFAEGPTAVYWNPAGLAKGIFNEARLIYNNWFEGIYYGFAAYRHNLKSGGLGAGITYLNSGTITRRENGRDISGSSYDLKNIAVSAGHGLKVSEYVNLGIAVKYIMETADGEAMGGISGGVGSQYQRKVEEHIIRAGVSVMNLGGKMGYDDKYPLPAVIRIGIGDELLNGRFRGGAECDYYLQEDNIHGGMGVEFAAAPFLDLRCGYRFGRKDVVFPYGVTAGFGVKYTEVVEYCFDYSIATIGDLGFVHRVGFGVRF